MVGYMSFTLELDMDILRDIVKDDAVSKQKFTFKYTDLNISPIPEGELTEPDETARPPTQI